MAERWGSGAEVDVLTSAQSRAEMSRYQAQQMHNEAFISLHTLPPLSALGPRLNLPPVSAHPSNAHT